MSKQQSIKRVQAASETGADYLVIGRPITQAADPAAAVRAILAEIEEKPAAKNPR